MNIIKYYKKYFCAAWTPMYFDLFGSSSSSDNSQTQNSDDQQNIVTGAAGSSTLNLSRSDGNNLSVNTTNVTQTLDAGAVGKSFDFAGKIADGAFKVTMDSTDKVYKTASNAMDHVADAYDAAGAREQSVINHAFDFAGDSQNRVTKAYEGANDITSKVTNNAISNIKDAYSSTANIAKDAYKDSADRAQDAYKDTAKTLDDAYKTSKAGEQKIMAAGALAIIAIVAVKVFK